MAYKMKNKKLNQWVKEISALCQPDKNILVRRQQRGI